MQVLHLEDLIELYGMGKNFWRTYLCRPEFNKFLVVGNGKFTYEDSPLFRCEIKMLLNKIIK